METDTNSSAHTNKMSQIPTARRTDGPPDTQPYLRKSVLSLGWRKSPRVSILEPIKPKAHRVFASLVLAEDAASRRWTQIKWRLS